MNPNRDKYPDPTAKKVERTLTAEELGISKASVQRRKARYWKKGAD